MSILIGVLIYSVNVFVVAFVYSKFSWIRQNREEEEIALIAMTWPIYIPGLLVLHILAILFGIVCMFIEKLSGETPKC
jgi:hypothetical protein